jgi:DNA mismatch repair ATPase MutL
MNILQLHHQIRALNEKLDAASKFCERVEELLASAYNEAAVKDGDQTGARRIQRILEDLRRLSEKSSCASA